MARRLVLASLLHLALLVPPAPAAAEEGAPRWWHGDLTVGTGFDWSQGDYGQAEETDIWYVPFTATYLFDHFLGSYEWDRFEVEVTVPYLRISGPGDFFRNGSGTEFFAETSTDQGLGDVLLRGTYLWFPEPGCQLPVVELSGRLKIPTANEDRDLGTGKTDFSLSLDLSRRLGIFTPFAGAGYRFVGTPSDSDIRNHAFASVGSAVRLREGLDMGLLYAWSEAATPRRNDSHELVSYLSFRPRPDLKLSPYVAMGLAGYTANYAFGLTLRYTIPRSSR